MIVNRNDSDWIGKHDLLIEFLQALIESKVQAPYDFVGEQRKWHLPRLNKMFIIATQLFPQQIMEAMSQAVSPYGDKILEGT